MDNLIQKAQSVFPGSQVVPERTFSTWFFSVRSRLDTAMILWPEAPVTCVICQGGGCYRCHQVGRVQLGPDPHDPYNKLPAEAVAHREEQKIELACRLLMNGRYHAPPDEIPWIDRAIDAVCARWKTLFNQNKPPF